MTNKKKHLNLTRSSFRLLIPLILFSTFIASAACDSDIKISGSADFDCNDRKDLEICDASASDANDSKYRLLTNENSALISWDPIKQALTYEVTLNAKPDCSGEPLQTYNSKITSATFDIDEDGIYHACVKAVFPGAKNLPESNYVFTIIRDSSPPEIAQAKANTLATSFNKEFSPELVVSDLTKLSYQWKKRSGPGDIIISDKTAKSPKIAASADGEYELEVIVTDELGHRVNHTIPFSWNQSKTIASLSSLQSSPTNANTINMIVEFSEDVSGFDVSDITISNGIASNFTNESNSKYTFDIQPSASGNVSVAIAADKVVGLSGNANTASAPFSITYDGVSPTVTLTSSASNPTNLSSFQMTATFSEPVTGFELSDISVGNGTATNLSGSEASYTFDVTPSTDGLVTIDIPGAIAADSAGNNNSAASQFSVTFDTTPPVFTSIALAGEAADGTINAADHTLSNDLADNLSASGHTSVSYLLIQDITTCAIPAGSFATSIPKNNSSLFSSDTDYRICIMLEDDAGNVTFGESEIIVFDETAPTGLSISIDEGEATNSDTINLSLAATGAAQMYITNTASCSAGGTWESYATSKASWTHGISNNTANVYVKFKDDAGNESECISSSVLHDSIAPSVDAGSDIISNSPANIDATASDTGSGISSYTWTKDAGSPTITFTSASAEDTTATASGDDSFTLTLTVTDNAGNSASDSLTYTYDATPPTAPSSVTIATSSPSDHPIMDISFTDGTDTHFLTHNIKACTDSACSAACVGESTDFSSPATINYLDYGSTYYACVQSVDTLGNASSYVASTNQLQLNHPLPPDPISLSATVNSDTEITLFWSSGGGSTSDYRISYQAGATAPLDCESGTQISDSAITGTSHKVTGLSYLSEYSFRVCAINSKASPDVSSGVTVSATAAVMRLEKITAGRSHTCGITNTGDAYCWGYNGNLQLGDGTGTDKNTPTSVNGSHTFTSISAGFTHTCGITDAEDAYCWGSGTNGRLGHGTAASKNSPTQVDGTHKFTSISAGGYHTCGITTTGDAYCWGSNSNGQLGDGTTDQRLTPTEVDGSYTFTSISAGEYHTCGITNTGDAYCWGSDGFGRLGNGAAGSQNTPTQVDGSLKFTRISAGGYHTCGITDAGDAYCWGLNTNGQLGDGTAARQNSPSLVVGSHTFTDISASTVYSTCGIIDTGAAYCWGQNNNGQLGDGTTTNKNTPTQVDGSYTFTSISFGYKHTCGITTSTGAAYCWGENIKGQLGNGTTSGSRKAPFAVTDSNIFTDLSAGGYHTCGITNTGAAYCWGSNNNGKLGDGTTTNKNTPTSVNGSHTFTSISAGDNHTCGITNTGAAYCWGLGSSGRLGHGTAATKYTPTQVDGSYTFTSISAGYTHTCGITSTGVAHCWGLNTYGQLGDGTAASQNSPTQVNGTHTFTSISAGGDHTCGITTTGNAYCWGYNNYGQLGDGTTDQRLTPTQVDGSHTFTSISSGRHHTCGITNTGDAYCWGYGSYGGLGDGTPTHKNTPTSVNGSYTFTSISAGGLHTCGITTSTGAAYCWGYNFYGQLGDGTTTNKNTPTSVNGSHTFTRISADLHHTCGITSTGTSYCWGNNELARLGIGAELGENGPIAVNQ